MEEMITVVKTCPLCDKENKLEVPKEGYDKWVKGEYIQNAMPRVPVDVREGLISGAHGKCFDEAFKEDGE